jgi:hypothetical protein
VGSLIVDVGGDGKLMTAGGYSRETGKTVVCVRVSAGILLVTQPMPDDEKEKQPM